MYIYINIYATCMFSTCVFSVRFVSIYVVPPYISTETTTAWKNLVLFYRIDQTSI